MHEVQALASLSAYEEPEKTSSIVRYYSAWMEDEYLCIQMELCESCACDIADFNNECAYTLLRDIFHALDVLHRSAYLLSFEALVFAEFMLICRVSMYCGYCVMHSV